MSAGVVDDNRGMDPVSHIRSLGLRLEDSHGFVILDPGGDHRLWRKG